VLKEHVIPAGQSLGTLGLQKTYWLAPVHGPIGPASAPTHAMGEYEVPLIWPQHSSPVAHCVLLVQ
jgi:hypothetical protein